MGNIQNYLNIKIFILCCQKQNKAFYKLKKYIFEKAVKKSNKIITKNLLKFKNVQFYSSINLTRCPEKLYFFT